MEWIIINIIESMLLSFFVSSFTEIKKYKYIYCSLLILCNFGVITVSNYYDMYDVYLTTIVICLTVFISYFFTYNTIYELLLISCFETVYSCLMSCLIVFISLLWSNISLSIAKQMFYFIGIICLIYSKKNIKLYLTQELTIILAIILYLMHFILQYLLQLYLIIKLEQPEIIVTFMMLFLCVLVLFVLFIKISQMNKKEVEYNRLKQQEDIEIVLAYLYEQLQITKHDLKHDFDLLNYYIEDRDYLKMKKLINAKEGTINRVPSFIHSQNQLLNIIINNKIIQAKSKNIHIKNYISVDKIIPMDELDLNDLLSNILDNAIENNREDGEIYIDIIQDQSFLNIKVKNTVAENKYSKQLVTWKNKKDHGYGLKSINRIVEKYQGKIDTSNNKETFEIIIILFLNK